LRSNLPQPGFPAFFGAVMVVTPFLPNEKSPGNPGRTPVLIEKGHI
jgi:hypothetical protein